MIQNRTLSCLTSCQYKHSVSFARIAGLFLFAIARLVMELVHNYSFDLLICHGVS